MPTLTRILAATDFSLTGNAAVARAAQIAAQHAAELRIVHATPDWNLFSNRVPMAQRHYEDLSRNAERLMNELKDRITSQFEVHVIGEIHQGRASEAIARCAGMYQPNLLVIGAHGENAAPGFSGALGTTTIKLVNQIKAPLLLVRDAETKRYATCIAAVGPLTEHARRVVHWANMLVTKGDCHIVRAYEVPYLERLRLSGLTPEAIATCNKDAELASQYAANPPWAGEKSNASIHMHLVRGKTLPSVLAEVSRHTAQLLVIGRHVQTPFAPEHPMMGCIGTQMAYHCPVDVLIVP